MTPLFIILGIILFFVIILLLPVKFDISYEDFTSFFVRILFFKIRILPKKEEKIRLRRFSQKNYRKMCRELDEKAEKKNKKKESKKSEKKEKKDDIHTVLEELKSVLLKSVSSLTKHTSASKLLIDVTVGSDNAAKSAIIYGAVAQFTAYCLELLRSKTDLKIKNESVSVRTDFASDVTLIHIHFIIKVRLMFLIHAVAKPMISYFINVNKGESK